MSYYLDSAPPFDFLKHLQQELGTAEDVTVRLLGEWLESYEPVARTAPNQAAPSMARDHLVVTA